MKILITGTAGFIGFHLARKLLERGDEVIGLDNINDYYDINLKYDRLKETGIEKGEIEEGKLVQSKKYIGYQFIKLDLVEKDKVLELFREEKFDKVVHLAAQAGVRYSIENPWAYIESNIYGHLSILEACRHNKIKHLVYASSSSVYGSNKKMPLSVEDNVDHPISLYAATKKSDELMAHTYSHLYGLPTTGLRFFTVYGPWGRPDMALYIFTKAIESNQSIDVYNNGEMWRDFTFVDDIVEGVMRVMDKAPTLENSKIQKSKSKQIPNSKDQNFKHPTCKLNPAISNTAPYRLYNIGCSHTEKLMDFIKEIEKKLGKKAKINFLPMQPGDVPRTFADVSELERDFGYKPKVRIEEGIGRFVEWYMGYYWEEDTIKN